MASLRAQSSELEPLSKFCILAPQYRSKAFGTLIRKAKTWEKETWQCSDCLSPVWRFYSLWAIKPHGTFFDYICLIQLYDGCFWEFQSDLSISPAPFFLYPKRERLSLLQTSLQSYPLCFHHSLWGGESMISQSSNYVHLHIRSGACKTKDTWAATDKMIPSNKQQRRKLTIHTAASDGWKTVMGLDGGSSWLIYKNNGTECNMGGLPPDQTHKAVPAASHQHHCNSKHSVPSGLKPVPCLCAHRCPLVGCLYCPVWPFWKPASHRAGDVCLGQPFERDLLACLPGSTHDFPTNIYWVRTMCQVLFYILKNQQWPKQTKIPDLKDLAFYILPMQVTFTGTQTSVPEITKSLWVLTNASPPPPPKSCFLTQTPEDNTWTEIL